MDAEWRKGGWVLHDDDRRRIVKIVGDEGWIEMPPRPTWELLQFYDSGHLGAVLKGLVSNEQNRHAYDYRIEGGKYLTQHNPNHPDSKPRECQIIYAGTLPTETNW
jgi:hypothetical protein